MKKTIPVSILAVIILVLPMSAFAAVCTPGATLIPSAPPEDFKDLMCLFTNNLNSLIPVLIGVTMIVFFWGLAKFIRSAGDEKSRTEGKKLMLWGVVGLFIMISVWGFVQILYQSVFGVSTSVGVPLLPT